MKTIGLTAFKRGSLWNVSPAVLAYHGALVIVLMLAALVARAANSALAPVAVLDQVVFLLASLAFHFINFTKF